MVSVEYCLMMARYNAWQNAQMEAAIVDMPLAELTKERGAFFGSILKTINHLLWADSLWLTRFGLQGERTIPSDQHLSVTPTVAAWSAERFRMDTRLLRWAEGLKSVDLLGDLHWYSTMKQSDMCLPKAQCVSHMFNHQTHHRGQVHAMVTAAGGPGWTTDLILMPEDEASF